jgi:hypothetical protein
MTSGSAASILVDLRVVDDERMKRAADPPLNARVIALKRFQQARFKHTYGDLLESARYGAAARFFLNELYGPNDFSDRDAQFVRVVPALVRLFPHEIVETVATLAELHALSETLDTALAFQLPGAKFDAVEYGRAWRATGREAQRQRQISLTLVVAEQLDGLTRKPLLRSSLRLMRAPARAAGLLELQTFLESGFDTFHAMRGAAEFIALVAAREQAFATALFTTDFANGSATETISRTLALLPSSSDLVDI